MDVNDYWKVINIGTTLLNSGDRLSLTSSHITAIKQIGPTIKVTDNPSYTDYNRLATLATKHNEK